MSIEVISIDDVRAAAVHTLGLDEQAVALDSPEAIAASLRRAASLLCPATPRTLVDAVLEVLTPVLPNPPARTELRDVLDQLLSAGDLLELAESGPDGAGRLLYLGPPSYIEKTPGHYLLTGIRPQDAPLAGPQVPIEHEGHLRTVALDPATAEAALREAGLHRIDATQWARLPGTLSAGDHLHRYRQRLEAAGAPGAVDGLTVIDPAARPNYYRGRWRPPRAGDTGIFVGRRRQAYGAGAWCAVLLSDGIPERLLDLPADHDPAMPGRDDAWRLQAAIDALADAPQTIRVTRRGGEAGERVADFFSPIPTWAQRLLELAGTPVYRSRGALFSYRLPGAALAGIASRLADTLWMTTTTDGDN